MTAQKLKIGTICKSWWSHTIAADTSNARRVKAELHRAKTPLVALGIAEVHNLHHMLKDAGHDLRYQKTGPDKLALIAVTLAHIKENSNESLAKLFGAGDPKQLSEMRFNTLIRSYTSRDLMRPLIRGLAVVGGVANVQMLAEDLYFWNNQTRTNWCFDYYDASDAKPTIEPIIVEQNK